MGNSASKKARLEQLERECAQTSSDLAAREQELATTRRGLEASKSQEQALSSEANALRRKCADLDALSKSLDEERAKQIAKLQGDLRLKSDEATASRRVVESRTQERDDARRLMKQVEERSQLSVREMEERSQVSLKAMEERSQLSIRQMEEKMQLAEQNSQTSSAEFETRRKELEHAAEAQSRELEEARLHSAGLADKVKQLEEKHDELTLEFETAQSHAQESLLAARAAAEQELVAFRTQASEELALAKSSMTDSARNLTSITTELAQTRAALSAATTKLQNLTITHNESVTRRTASYEAFTATKQELVDAQKRFLELHDSHEKLKGESASAALALKAEREAKEAATMELAALRKKLVESDARKGFSEVSVQQVSVGAA